MCCEPLRTLTQEELTRVEADARDEERLKVGKAEDDARRNPQSAQCQSGSVAKTPSEGLFTISITI